MSVAAGFKPDWKQWEGEIVDGQFPLQRLLAEDTRGAVFLTRFASAEAAIKIASTGDMDRFVDRWSRAAKLHHPHLIGVFKVGRLARMGRPLGYVVTEHAEESLATVLQQRALTPDEVLDLLGPLIDVMAFLHGQGYMLGGLKPSKILAVRDTLKISSGVLAGGDRSTDLRALAATATQALTQKPAIDGETPGALPEPFLEFTRKCLDRSPCSAEELGIWLRAPRSADSSIAGQQSTTARPKRTLVMVAIATLFLVTGLAILLRNRPARAPIESPVVSAAPQPAATVPDHAAVATTPPASDREPRPPRQAGVVQGPAIRQVVHQVLPDISAKDRRTIRGKATVIVNVVVNPAGDVTEAIRERGSRYFGRLAIDAARQWRFASSNAGASRQYYLRFEITRTNIKAAVQKTLNGR